MSRKRRTSPFEDLIEVASLLPYWVSLIIAVITYVFFHSYAAADAQAVIQPGSAMPQNLGGMMFRTFSVFLQYIVPGAFVFGALISGFKAFSGKRLAKRYVEVPEFKEPSQESSQSAQKVIKPTDEMNWQQFELLVGEAFRQAGYRVIDGGDAGADGGVDVHLSKDGNKYFVQCKHWKTRKVGVAIVRELFGVIAGAGVKGGFVVTSGDFTEEAKAFAKGKQLGLINDTKLDKMIRTAQKTLPESALREAQSPPETPVCPKCVSTMVKRKARQGARAGQEFWGCSQFPKCRGIEQV
ncbi:restriction endonuclease [Amphritea sp.]|uniref:restriction endonuclease n=1 Tax=Amphritea sp. TaxID=1872502 RepID=UPI0025B9DCC2|nr:restriction endonuclease [Amphritea sp.]